MREELSGRKAAKEEAEKRAAEQEEAALRLQALRRGQSARWGVAAEEAEVRRQREEAARREEAVVRIQATARGGLARDRVTRDLCDRGGGEMVARARVQAAARRAEGTRQRTAASGTINAAMRGRAGRRAVGRQREAAAAAVAEAAAAAAAAEAEQQAETALGSQAPSHRATGSIT